MSNDILHQSRFRPGYHFFAVFLDNERIQAWAWPTNLSEYQRRRIAYQFCKHHNIGLSGVAVCRVKDRLDIGDNNEAWMVPQ